MTMHNVEIHDNDLYMILTALHEYVHSLERKRKRALKNKTVNPHYNDETRGIEIENIEQPKDKFYAIVFQDRKD